MDTCAGWEVGDSLVLGPTGHLQWHGRSDASEATIASVSLGGASCTIGLTAALTRTHHACDDCHGVRKYADVSNLNRSISLTGPWYARDAGSAARDAVPQRGG